jgi:putative acetyltransferase
MVFAGSIAAFRPEWADAIDGIVTAAFGGPGEARLVRDLRRDGAVAVERVAMEAGGIAGHVLFSRCTLEPATIRVAALAPVAVAPARQRAGIGSALILEGLTQCAAQGFDAVVLLGDPAYYRRFGFTRRAARVLESVYSGPAFQALELRDGALAGGPWRLAYPKAFVALD